MTDPASAPHQPAAAAAQLPAAYQHPYPPAADAAEQAAIRVQAASPQPGYPPDHAVAVATGPVIEFMERTYRVANQLPTMALLEFAAEADKGTGTEDPGALATMYHLLRRSFLLAPPCRNFCPPRCGCKGKVHCQACTAAGDLAEEVPGCPQFNPGDWPRFRIHALDVCAEPEDLFKVVEELIQRATGRPT